MKKLLSVFIVACMLFSFTSPVYATLSDNISADVIDLGIDFAVREFLNSYYENVYLYEDSDFSAYTVASLSTSELASHITHKGSQVQLSSYLANIDFLADKIEYWKYVRQDQSIYRTNFLADIQITDWEIDGNSASVNVTSMLTYRYIDCIQDTYCEERYNIELVKIGSTWLVSDFTEPYSWFDAAYKGNPSFDVGAVITEYAIGASQAAELTATVIQSQPTATNDFTQSNILRYDRHNAAAYAYTYTTTGTSNHYNYYNKNFKDWHSVGADCMNFVSQCIWAGLGGSNSITSINSRVVPMDNAGTYTWYNSSPTVSSSTPSWRGCGSFRSYVTNSNNASGEIGLRANVIHIPTNGNFSSITNYTTNLIGAVLHVEGVDNGAPAPYGHAIIITDVEGPNRNQIFYCGHTLMAKYQKLSDAWSSCPMYLIEPTTFVAQQGNTPMQVSVEMYRPFPVGTTKTLTATVDTTCYRIQTSVTTPSGGGSIQNNYTTRTGSMTYTFQERGLYTIRISVFLDSTGITTDYYYTIRTY